MILATDLDGTFLGGKHAEKLKLYRLIRENKDIRLIFVTGRGMESVLPLLDDPIIPNPDYIICDVGATILNGRTLEPIEPIQSQIESNWPGSLAIQRKLRKMKGLKLQRVPQQRRCSYYFDAETKVDEIRQLVKEFGCDVLLSADQYLDVLPGGVNKGYALTQLVSWLNQDSREVLVAGDTLNDYSLYETAFKGVVVGEAEQALLDQTASMPHVYQAKLPGAAGILEAIQHFPEFKEYYVEMRPAAKLEHTGATQLLMLYHRLPYEFREIQGKIERVPPKSPNGIIPSLLGFFGSGRAGAWIAWEEASSRKQTSLKNVFIDQDSYPNLVASRIPLTRKDVDLFYKSFSKEAFWPIIFSFIDKAHFNHDHWEHYCRINKLFAEKTADEADHGAMVWIHEYNLWMVPAYLRPLRPDLKIGFFHHTSFPPADIFNTIPWRREIIGSLLQCDYIGFHIPRYVVNFVDVVKSHAPAITRKEQNCGGRFLTFSSALGVESMPTELEVNGRTVRLGAHPVGVNVSYIKELFQQPQVAREIEELKEHTRDKKIILSIERLDYVKGPLEKLKAFNQFLQDYPEFHGRVELIYICTPPAAGMRVYEKVQSELEQVVGKINGKFSNLQWTPIRFFFRSFPFEEILQYYALADVCWITPLRDGLNLVAKEYVAVQGQVKHAKGALVVSEFAGVSAELPYVIRTNPYDLKDLKQSLLHALTMDESERNLRMKRLYDIVSYYDVQRWGQEFMDALEAI